MSAIVPFLVLIVMALLLLEAANIALSIFELGKPTSATDQEWACELKDRVKDRLADGPLPKHCLETKWEEVKGDLKKQNLKLQLPSDPIQTMSFDNFVFVNTNLPTMRKVKT